jgi:predicted nucleic acid-binding protein
MGGQISLPAAVRRRWGTSVAAVEDHGDSVVVRPIPDDPMRMLRDDACAIPAVNLAESLVVAQRRHAVEREHIVRALEPLLDTVLSVVEQGERAAWRAAELRRLHHDPRTAPLSLADCLLLAAADAGDRIATADVPVASVARDIGVEVVPLPDSSGSRPATS